MFTLKQAQTILNYGRLDGAPVNVETIVANLKDAGKWPED